MENYFNRVTIKPAYCMICENKGTDQLRGKRTADQRLCFSYIDKIVFVSLFCTA